jgi:nucleoside-triphosphatase
VRHVLLTGLPGIGKTTLIRELAKRLAASQPAGFYTEEIREKEARKGFRLVTLDGRELTLAHVNNPGPFRVGRYKVDVAGFERLLAALDLRHASPRVIIIDEIGKMECLSRRFTEDLTALLDSSKTVIATIALKGTGFIQQIKQRPDCCLITVTVANRNSLAASLFTELQHTLGHSS